MQTERDHDTKILVGSLMDCVDDFAARHPDPAGVLRAYGLGLATIFEHYANTGHLLPDQVEALMDTTFATIRQATLAALEHFDREGRDQS